MGSVGGEQIKFFLEEAILPVKDVARLLGENRGKILGCGGEALTRLQSLK